MGAIRVLPPAYRLRSAHVDARHNVFNHARAGVAGRCCPPGRARTPAPVCDTSPLSAIYSLWACAAAIKALSTR